MSLIRYWLFIPSKNYLYLKIFLALNYSFIVIPEAVKFNPTGFPFPKSLYTNSNPNCLYINISLRH